MKYWVAFLLIWNSMLTMAIYLSAEVCFEEDAKIAKHIVISHTTMHERFKNHEHNELD